MSFQYSSPQQLHNDRAQRADRPVSRWIEAYTKSEAHRSLVAQLSRRELMTDLHEISLIYGLIQYLQPEWCVEIGTFFAHSAQIMAEAIAESGGRTRLVTIDPFGRDRAPGIIASWPKRLQEVTEFRPVSSMDFFLDLETRGVPKGAASPVGIVFVDGHHNFEYALFDIIRSADHLTPGGVIVVDNLEQEGPADAVRRFLTWNPGWKLFYEGRLWDGGACPEFACSKDIDWGVLLSPPGIQIAAMGHKMQKRGLADPSVFALTFNLVEASRPGTLRINFLYMAQPYDAHISGMKGCQARRIVQDCPVSPGSTSIHAEFATPIIFDSPASAMNIFYELELRYRGDADRDAYILLDPKEPVSLASLRQPQPV
jgi:predicted O-methyltransferase YrrM